MWVDMVADREDAFAGVGEVRCKVYGEVWCEIR
jgi:hypothetical protein